MSLEWAPRSYGLLTVIYLDQLYTSVLLLVRSNVSSVSDSDVGDQYSIIIIITIIIIINELMMVA